jgi:hypothetical protein
MINIFAAGSETFPVNGETLYSFDRPAAEYKNVKYIRTHCNALFVHQFSHGFFDFRGKKDRLGADWFENSVQASLGHWLYCTDNPQKFKTFSEKSWGQSACRFKHGYSGAFGAEPCAEDAKLQNDGTVPPYAALASMPFTPEQSLAALEHYAGIPELWGKYGLIDSYNLDEEPPHFERCFLGIDKGITLVMLANYENGFVWEHFMKNECVLNGMKAVGIHDEI